MPAAKKTTGVNHLLKGLVVDEYDKILASCENVQLSFGSCVYERDRPMEFVYFPTTSFIALVTKADPRQSLEMGMVGSEGMLGASVALGTNIAPFNSVVQGAGHALQMSVTKFEQHLRDCKSLRQLVNRYLYVLIAQLSRSAACTHFHAIEPRLARWLLMTHDRAQTDSFHITHEFLADMLGVRRSGVTIAAGSLQQKNLISYTRGLVCVINRQGLEHEACKCYTALSDSYAHLLH